LIVHCQYLVAVPVKPILLRQIRNQHILVLEKKFSGMQA